MKKLPIFLVITTSFFISSCSTPATPNYYNGKYYMAGDENCIYMRQLDENRIMCQNAARQNVGYRNAMTDQQLQMYMHQQSISQANNAMMLQYLQSTKPVNCTSSAIGNQVYTNCH